MDSSASGIHASGRSSLISTKSRLCILLTSFRGSRAVGEKIDDDPCIGSKTEATAPDATLASCSSLNVGSLTDGSLEDPAPEPTNERYIVS